MAGEGLQWELLADTYRKLFHNVLFREVPDTVYRVVGSAGFVDVVEITARGVRDSFPDLVKECCQLSDAGGIATGELHEKLESLVKCHNLVASMLHGMARLSILESTEDRMVIRVTMPASAASSARLLNAVRSGIVVGILRALGVEAHALISREHERLLHCPSDCYAVYVECVNEKEYRVVIEKR